jgi:predicted RNA-binding protein YlxR (DUF448 family)
MPERTCIVCRRKEVMPPKRELETAEGEVLRGSRQQRVGHGELVRLAIVGRSVVLDRARAIPGRGMYVHLSEACCVKLAQVGKVARALRVEISALDGESLKAVVSQLVGGSQQRQNIKVRL